MRDAAAQRASYGALSRPARSLLGAARLGLDCVSGVVTAVEQMHAAIARRAPAWSPRSSETALAEPIPAPGPVSASVYASLRAAARLAGRGLELPFELALANGLHGPPAPGDVAPTEGAWIAALNGLCGDHLESSGNPLAIPMGLLTPERVVEPGAPIEPVVPAATSHIVVLIHGLCLSERQWLRSTDAHLGKRLADELGYTPLYLRYNTGRHISTNGRELAEQLERVVDAWPVPIESLALVGHSMGGLVLRSACWYADKGGHRWLEPLRKVVCLGTPHHGAPLAKGGHWFTAALGASPYAHPLSFGRFRSAGIKDLRHGNLLDEDWQGRDPDALEPDARMRVPLLEGVEYYLAAATLGRHEHSLVARTLGDLLVRSESALGAHPDAARRLPVRPENTRVFRTAHHFDLLGDPAVHQQIVAWLGAQR